MPRLSVPRSTRTTYGTVMPVSVVVMARSAGAVAVGSNGLKQPLAGGAPFGSGSDSVHPAGGVPTGAVVR